MGRGLSQRRRVTNYEKAKQAKSGTLPLPPPPEEVERLNNKNKRKKKRQVGSQAPASFRRMMRVKAFVERKDAKNVPAQEGSSAAERRNKLRGGASAELKGISASGPLSSLMGSPQLRDPPQPAESSGGEEAAAPEEREPQEPSRNLPDKPEATTLYGVKAMKPKKREFLKKRKQRKQGQGGAGEEAEGSLEASIMEDRHKPAFGEQAMQPLKVNLKRKHWKGENSAEKTSKRLKEVFQRQMQNAEAVNKQREAEKATLAEAFREQKRAKNNTVTRVRATPATLSALVKRNIAAAGEQ